MCSDLIIEKISMIEFTVKEVTVFSVATFLNEALRQICLLEIYEIFNLTNRTNLGCDFNKE